jgi:hypothetical protein
MRGVLLPPFDRRGGVIITSSNNRCTIVHAGRAMLHWFRLASCARLVPAGTYNSTAFGTSLTFLNLLDTKHREIPMIQGLCNPKLSCISNVPNQF